MPPLEGRSRLSKVVEAALIATLTFPSWAAAQVTLRGQVLDSEMGSALPGATVRIGNDTASFRTDTSGFFIITGLPGGVTDIRIQMIGFEEGLFRLRLPLSGVVDHQFSLDFNGFMLPEVVVQARAEILQPRYIDFERRRQRKLGAFVRWDDIKKAGYNTVGDALRMV